MNFIEFPHFPMVFLCFSYAFPMVPMTFLGAQDGHPGRRSPGASAFPWTTPVTTWTAKLPGGDGCPMSW